MKKSSLLKISVYKDHTQTRCFLWVRGKTIVNFYMLKYKFYGASISQNNTIFNTILKYLIKIDYVYTMFP